MLTMKGYLLIGTALAFLALTGVLALTRDALSDAKEKIVQLEQGIGSRDRKIADLEAQALRVSTTAVAQSEGAAIICRGTGAALFERGRQLGRAEACAAVTVH